MGTVERSVRRHFKAELRAVRVPAPPAGPGRVREGAPPRLPRALVDGLARAAAVAVAVGSLVLLAAELPRSSVLETEVTALARERAWEAFLPRAEAVLDLIARSL
jgi:hypothetical protein